MTDDMPKISHTEYSTFKLAGPQQKNTDIIRLVFSCTQEMKGLFFFKSKKWKWKDNKLFKNANNFIYKTERNHRHRKQTWLSKGMIVV